MSELPSPEGTSRSKALENTQSYVVGGDKPHIIRQLTPEEINPHANEPQPGTPEYDQMRNDLKQQAKNFENEDRDRFNRTQSGEEINDEEEQPLGTARIYRNSEGELERVVLKLPVNSAKEVSKYTGPDASEEKRAAVNELLGFAPVITIDGRTGVMKITSKDNPDGVTLSKAPEGPPFEAGIIVNEGQLPPEDRLFAKRPEPGTHGYGLMTDFLYAYMEHNEKQLDPVIAVSSRAIAQRGDSVVYMDTKLKIADLSRLIDDIDRITKPPINRDRSKPYVSQVDTMSVIPYENVLVNVGQTSSDSLPGTGALV